MTSAEKETLPTQHEVLWRGNRYNYRWTSESDMDKLKPFSLSSAIIFNNKRQILIICEDDEWRLPGGGPKNQENSRETVVREVEEETNVSLKEISLLGAFCVEPVDTNENSAFQVHYTAKVEILHERKPDPESGKVYEYKFVDNPTDYIQWGELGERLFETATKKNKDKKLNP